MSDTDALGIPNNLIVVSAVFGTIFGIMLVSEIAFPVEGGAAAPTQPVEAAEVAPAKSWWPSTPRKFTVKVFVKLKGGDSQKQGGCRVCFARKEVADRAKAEFVPPKDKMDFDAMYFIHLTAACARNDDTQSFETDADGVAKVEIPGDGKWVYYAGTSAGSGRDFVQWFGEVQDKLPGNELLLSNSNMGVQY